MLSVIVSDRWRAVWEAISAGQQMITEKGFFFKKHKATCVCL
jgi:hypothetical protein